MRKINEKGHPLANIAFLSRPNHTRHRAVPLKWRHVVEILETQCGRSAANQSEAAQTTNCVVWDGVRRPRHLRGRRVHGDDLRRTSTVSRTARHVFVDAARVAANVEYCLDLYGCRRPRGIAAFCRKNRPERLCRLSPLLV